MKSKLSILTLFLCAVNVFSQTTILRRIYFENNNAQLSVASQLYLKSLADSLKKSTISAILLKGHTDATGTFNQNLALSEKRALIVKEEFLKNGITQELLAINAQGTSEPIGDNTTETGKKSNRRVDILLTFNPNKQSNTESSAPKKTYQNMRQLYSDIGQTFQNFKINTTKDTILVGEKGTVLFIPKDAFEGVPVNTNIDFRLKEVYSISDMITENLTTQSGDKLLQTGGMIYIDALYNGKVLSLKKQINASFASKESQRDDMLLFRGQREKGNNGNIDWTPLSKDGLEEEVILYMGSGKSVPDIIADKDGYLTFKDIIDTTGFASVFQNSKAKTNINTIKLDNLNKAQLKMVIAARANSQNFKGSFQDIHALAFKETYDFYKVNNFKDLIKKNSQGWDSLTAAKMVFIKQGEISAENNRLREIRRKEVQDSLARAYDLWYESLKDGINNVQKKGEYFNVSFPLSYLGWFNCDAYNNAELATMQVELPQSEMYNIIFALKKERGAIKSYARNGLIELTAPKNTDGILIGMKILDGQSYLALLETNSSNKNIKLDYKPASADEIKLLLKPYNR